MSRIPPASVLILALAVPLLSTITTLQGYYGAHPPEKVFLGFRYMSGDHYQYASLMRQAQKDGRFLMENLYTTEPQKGSYVFLYYWLLGSVARLTGATLAAIWELFRFLGGFLLIVVYWRFTSCY